MTGIVQQCAQDANNQISAANAQVEAANGQTAAANATIANAAAALSALQGQADENGMISAESLGAVLSSLGQADAGVAGVDGIKKQGLTNRV